MVSNTEVSGKQALPTLLVTMSNVRPGVSFRCKNMCAEREPLRFGSKGRGPKNRAYVKLTQSL
eukprot:2099113-Amphidinium_carterae.1